MPRRVIAKPHILIPLAALCAILPLILHGPSCGHDEVFHLQSWLDAAHQLRHGTLFPHWAFTPAWNAGEPRFLFYPPLSWYLGATLVGALHLLHLPITAAPILFIWIALTVSGLTFFHFARNLFEDSGIAEAPNKISPNAALLAAVLYLANPYMLFNAYERSAFAELLAAAWVPLLLLAVLRKRPTIPGLALPIALLWLTNAPAAVMGCYTLALLATLRIASTLFWPPPKSVILSEGTRASASAAAEEPVLSLSKEPATPPAAALPPAPFQPPPPLIPNPSSLLPVFLAGTALGLTLPAFYLLPAAYEQRYVQVAMAIIPSMRFQDNFLFTLGAHDAHNVVNHQVSLIALTLLLLTTATLSALLLVRKPKPSAAVPSQPDISSQIAKIRYPEPSGSGLIPSQEKWGFRPGGTPSYLLPSLTILTFLLALLLVPLSTPIWNHLPKLAFLQFPWRLLTILAPITALTLALLLNRRKPTSFLLSTVYCLLSALLLSLLATHLYRQHCELNDTPLAVAQLLHTHHGTGPTDEYTPLAADNDVLRTGNPAFWLAAHPNDPAPNTLPTPAELNPNLENDDTPVPLDQTLSTPAPHHLQFHANAPGYLILNLRDYPNWDITETDTNSPSLNHPTHNLRDDGLTALTLHYPSDYTIDIHWHRTPDQNLGLAVTLLALFALLLLLFRQSDFLTRRRSGTPRL